MQDKITEFKEEYRFLSNFFPVEIEHEGYTYQSVEHAYVASKCNDKRWKGFCSSINTTAGQVKRAGKDKKLGKQLREDWQEVKLEIMYQLLCKKFAQEPFKTKLQETGDKVIEEGNQWGDTFWGIDVFTGEGENHLGRMLMQVRGVSVYFEKSDIVPPTTYQEFLYKENIPMIERLREPAYHNNIAMSVFYKNLNEIVVRTSDLGYTMSYYNVRTNATVEQLTKVNYNGLIPTHRAASTTITQLKEAAEKSGYMFEYTTITENLQSITEEVKDLKIDYTAHFGNY